jgi:hypothetical protein
MRNLRSTTKVSVRERDNNKGRTRFSVTFLPRRPFHVERDCTLEVSIDAR